MTKAVISNKIYLNCDKGSDLEEHLRSKLTYEIYEQPGISEFPTVIRHMTRISDTVVTIPSGRLDLVPSDYQIIDKRSYADAEIPEPSFTLRDDQQDAEDYFTSTGQGGIVECKPG